MVEFFYCHFNVLPDCKDKYSYYLTLNLYAT